jgi:hypothetical protein
MSRRIPKLRTPDERESGAKLPRLDVTVSPDMMGKLKREAGSLELPTAQLVRDIISTWLAERAS